MTQRAKRKASKTAERDGNVPRRPLRLSAVGVKQELSPADKDFISMAKKHDFEVKYQQKNPKMKGKEAEGKISWRLYEKFKMAKNLKEALELGATMDRINDDYAKGYIRFPGRESKEPGHVFMANAEEATDLISLLGMDPDINIEECGEEFATALDKAASAAKKVPTANRMSFSEAIANCHDPQPMRKLGFKQNVAYPCVWTRTRNGKPQIITSYVDDCTVAVMDDKARDELMSEMRERFEIKEGEGQPINYLLGILIKQDLEAGTVTLTQELAATKLADAFLTEEEKVKASSVNHPMLHSVVLPRLKEKEVSKEKFNYLSAIGSLLYLSGCTRPDIAAATGILARHGATPGAVHVKAVKRLIQYVYNTRNYGIQYKRDSGMDTNTPKIFGQGRHPKDNGKNHMTVFTDSDYAADESKRSTQGSIVFMNGGPISSSSVLGRTICLSICEVEVMAAVAASKEAIHLKLLLGELGINHDKLIIEEDNAACIAQAKGGLRFIRKAKHYQIALRFIQKLHVDGEVEFKYCETKEQIADLFTKALDEPKFTYFRDKIMYRPAES